MLRILVLESSPARGSIAHAFRESEGDARTHHGAALGAAERALVGTVPGSAILRSHHGQARSPVELVYVPAAEIASERVRRVAEKVSFDGAIVVVGAERPDWGVVKHALAPASSVLLVVDADDDGARAVVHDDEARTALSLAGHTVDARHVLSSDVTDDPAAIAAVAEWLATLEPKVHAPAFGTVFDCASCGAELTMPVLLRAPPPLKEAFVHNRNYLDDPGTFALGAGTRWSRPVDEPASHEGPPGAALLDVEACVESAWQLVGDLNGCCGVAPLDAEPNLVCAKCQQPLGWCWSECVFHAVMALLLERVVRRELGPPLTLET